LRRSLTDASHRDRDSIEDAIPLRDLQTPPPAYSPYQFSQADRELLGVSYPMGGLHGSERFGNYSDMIGQAYPLGDRGRHRST
jgi:hypothetical protein